MNSDNQKKFNGPTGETPFVPSWMVNKEDELIQCRILLTNLANSASAYLGETGNDPLNTQKGDVEVIAKILWGDLQKTSEFLKDRSIK